MTATPTRIYLVLFEEEERLIEATNAAHAIRHCTEPYKARLASQGDLVRLLGAGAEVEKAG